MFCDLRICLRKPISDLYAVRTGRVYVSVNENFPIISFSTKVSKFVEELIFPTIKYIREIIINISKGMAPNVVGDVILFCVERFRHTRRFVRAAFTFAPSASIQVARVLAKCRHPRPCGWLVDHAESDCSINTRACGSRRRPSTCPP